jgi:uncharacterized protein YecE (DUF72 family)
MTDQGTLSKRAPARNLLRPPAAGPRTASATPEVIRVGTSGFSYDDWKGFFYPREMRASEFLAFYARHFDACELNFTYYRVPDARTLGRMVDKSGGAVDFTLKAYKAMTHDRDATRETIAAFVEALLPLREADRCGAVLLQFPFSFRRDEQALGYLEGLAGTLRELWDEIPLVAEFRHRSWVSEEAQAWLRERAIGFCAVDEPRMGNLMPPVAIATSGVGYVRFHGRNAARWWRHERPEQRYDYLYRREELAEWLPKIDAVAAAAKKTYVFFNNHFQAKAVANARDLLALLRGEEGTEDEPAAEGGEESGARE